MQTPPSSAAAPIKAKPQCPRDSSRVSAIRPVAKSKQATSHMHFQLETKGQRKKGEVKQKAYSPRSKAKKPWSSLNKGMSSSPVQPAESPSITRAWDLRLQWLHWCVHSTQLNTHVHQEGDPGTNGMGLNSLQQIALPKAACSRCRAEVLQLIGQWESQQPVRWWLIYVSTQLGHGTWTFGQTSVQRWLWRYFLDVVHI